MKTERSYNFSTSKSIKSLLKLVGAGLKRPPARKSGFAFGCGEKQNYGFYHRRKQFSFRTLLGRALKPRPYNCKGYFSYVAAAIRNPSCTASNV